MGPNDKLLDLVTEQKKITAEYEELIKQISFDKDLNELKGLRDGSERLSSELSLLEEKYESQVSDNIALKNSLMEQMLSEKIAIINGSQRKISLYFDRIEDSSHNKLHNLEKVAMERINRVKDISDDLFVEKSSELIRQLNQVESNLQYLVTRQKEIIKEDKVDILEDLKKEYDELKNEVIDERLVIKKKRENDLEVKIGLDVINKVGIILLLLGVTTALRYSFTNWIGEDMKTILGFLFGGLLLGLGEWLNRKGKGTFALGMVGGGIGMLYLAVFSSYFILNTLPLTTATIVSLLVTVMSIVFAKRYTSQTITGLSLIGGYLPFYSYLFIGDLDVNGIYIAMAYLLLLNLTILMLSLERRWVITKWLSFGLNILSSVYLMFSLGNDRISLVYSSVIFMMYLGIVLYKPLLDRSKLHLSEIVLLGSNTVINFAIVYGLFYNLGWSNFTGILAMVYGVVYYVLGQLTSRRGPDLKLTSDIFYSTAITFAVLMIPFQYGIQWISLGWLVESVLFIYMFQSRYKEEKKLENAGWIILGLSVGSFVLFNSTLIPLGTFLFRYSAITLALLFVLKLYLPEINQEYILERTGRIYYLSMYKYFVILFSWVYLIRVGFISYQNVIDPGFDYAFFFLPAIFALVTAGYSYLLTRLDVLKDNITSAISMGMNVLVIFTSLSLTETSTVGMPSVSVRMFAVSILLVYNIFIFFSIKSLVLNVIKSQKLSLEIFPLSMAIYLLGSIPLFLMNQFEIVNANLVISLIFVVLSFIYIVYGFKERYMLIRRFGLFLSMFATAKLFIFDLMFLSTLGKVVAYISFGLTLLAISYVYQKLKESSDVDVW